MPVLPPALFSVFLTQFTMVGLFFSKKASMQGYLTLALSAVTYLYQVRMKTPIAFTAGRDHLPMEPGRAATRRPF